MDIEITVGETEDIMQVFLESIEQIKPDDEDRVVLTSAQAKTLAQCIKEFEEEGTVTITSSKPLLFYLDPPTNFYLNPKAIAFIGFEANGNAVVQVMTGSMIKIEALQWRLAEKQILEAFHIVRIRSSGGLVSA